MVGALIAAGAGPAVAYACYLAGVRVQRTHDMATVRQIVTHPAIWPHAHEDGMTDAWEPEDSEAMMWVLVTDPHPIGVFLVHPRGVQCLEMHTCLLPIAWGPTAAHAAQLLLKWAFQSGNCRKMVTSVPAYNRAALRFAKAGGMTQEGINRASYLHNGEMVDQIMLGVTREEWLCRQQQS